MTFEELKYKHLGAIAEGVYTEYEPDGKPYDLIDQDKIELDAAKISVGYTIGVLENLQKDFMDKFFIKSAKDIQDKILELKQLLK